MKNPVVVLVVALCLFGCGKAWKPETLKVTPLDGQPLRSVLADRQACIEAHPFSRDDHFGYPACLIARGYIAEAPFEVSGGARLMQLHIRSDRAGRNAVEVRSDLVACERAAQAAYKNVGFGYAVARYTSAYYSGGVNIQRRELGRVAAECMGPRGYAVGNTAEEAALNRPATPSGPAPAAVTAPAVPQLERGGSTPPWDRPQGKTSDFGK